MTVQDNPKPNELSHHGVKGQKWYIRRYQNADGTLTAEGRERLLVKARRSQSKANASVATNYLAKSRKARLQEKANYIKGEVKRSDLIKARQAKKSANQTNSKDTSKSSQTKDVSKKKLSDMSDDELEAYVTQKERRARLEQRYSNLNPKEVSAGRKFASYAFQNVVKPVATNVAKDYSEKMVKEFLGLSNKKTTSKSESEKLRDLAMDYENRQKVDRGQQYFKEGPYDEKKKKK